MSTPTKGRLYVRLGAELRRLRIAADLTLAEAHKRAGVSLGYISQIELGKNAPSLAVLCRLAAAVGAAPGDVVAAATAPEPPESA